MNDNQLDSSNFVYNISKKIAYVANCRILISTRTSSHSDINSRQYPCITINLTGNITSFVRFLTSNTPIEGLWALVCSLQLMSYLTMMDVNMPNNLQNFMKYIEKVHTFGAVVPNVFGYIASTSSLTVTPNENFRNRGYNYTSALMLAGSDIEMIILQSVAIPLISSLYAKTKFKLLATAEEKIKYNMVLRTYVVAYVRIALAVSINFLAFSNGSQYFLNIMAMIVGILIIFTPTLLSMLLSVKMHQFNPKDNNILMRKRFGTLVDIAKYDNGLFAMNFYPIFLFKRLAYALVLVAGFKWFGMQLVVLAILSFIFIAYIVIVRPIVDTVSHRNFIIAEIGYMFMLVMLSVMKYSKMNDKANDIVGLITIVGVCTMIVSCWISFFRNSIPETIAKIKDKFCKKKKIKKFKKAKMSK